jgi:hypothetical protein
MSGFSFAARAACSLGGALDLLDVGVEVVEEVCRAVDGSPFFEKAASAGMAVMQSRVRHLHVQLRMERWKMVAVERVCPSRTGDESPPAKNGQTLRGRSDMRCRTSAIGGSCQQ